MASKANIHYPLRRVSPCYWICAVLTDEQLLMAEKIFEEFRDKELMPAYVADVGPEPRPPRSARASAICLASVRTFT